MKSKELESFLKLLKAFSEKQSNLFNSHLGENYVMHKIFNINSVGGRYIGTVNLLKVMKKDNKDWKTAIQTPSMK